MMWEKIFTDEVINRIIVLSEETEDKETIKLFSDFVEAEIDYKVVVVIAMQWATFTDSKQANIAINYAGEEHASRFIMLLDILSKRFKEGELK